MISGVCIRQRAGGHWIGLPAEPWKERRSYWLAVEAGRHSQAQYNEGWRAGLRSPLPSEIAELARSFARVPGCAVSVFGAGAPGGGEPSESTIIGFKVGSISNKRESAVFLTLGAIGDCEPEELDAAGVGSATALGVLCARLALGSVHVVSEGERLKGRPAHPLAAQAAEVAAWAGPMMIYRASGPATQAWDQRSAYLRAWDQPWPVDGVGWTLREGRAPLNNPTAIGFALVEVDWPGTYPCVPAAVSGDIWRVPMRGRSVVPVSLWALRELLIPAGVEVVRVLASVVTSQSHYPDFRARWADQGCGRKSVYQRAFSGLAPGERWIGMPSGNGWRWVRQEPDPGARPDLAALGRWAVAGRTAAALHQLGERGGEAVASHIDCIFEADSGGAVGHQLPELVGEDGWALKDQGDMRCYGPGRYDLAGQARRMGGGNVESTDEDGVWLNARTWAGDPRYDPDAFSEPLDADTVRGMYSYTFGNRRWTGEHGTPR